MANGKHPVGIVEKDLLSYASFLLYPRHFPVRALWREGVRFGVDRDAMFHDGDKPEQEVAGKVAGKHLDAAIFDMGFVQIRHENASPFRDERGDILRFQGDGIPTAWRNQA